MCIPSPPPPPSAGPPVSVEDRVSKTAKDIAPAKKKKSKKSKKQFSNKRKAIAPLQVGGVSPKTKAATIKKKL